jgi:hypothetical protein
MAVEQQVNLLEVVDKRPRFEPQKCNRETAGIETAAANIPDLAEPGLEPAVRTGGKRSRLLLQSLS